jgi:hypothetical protein
MTKTFPSPYLFGNDTRRSGPLPTASPVSGAARCPGYDNYKYGVTELNAYANRTGANDIRLHYPSRKVTYIIGEKVSNDDHFPERVARRRISGLMEQAAIHFGAARRLRSRQSFRLALRDECVVRQRRLRRPVTGARTLQ